MKNAFLGAMLALLAALVATPAYAGKGGPPAPTVVPPTVSTSARNDNKLYVGINWNFGVRTGATAVIGYRAAKVNAGARAHGFKAELTYVLSGAPMGLGEGRIKYLAGSREAQGELGAGYSFASAAPLLNAGVQGALLNGGLDYVFGKGILASVGVNTLRKPHGPNQTLSCPSGFTLQPPDCVSND